MDKQELGAFLRSRRERLRPEDVGLPSGSRRRTPGLRREEAAVLAHISTEYYVRLEFARLWERHDVQAAPMLTKTFRHPVVGEITVDCDSLTLTDRDQHLVLYSAPPGSHGAEALALLNVLGAEAGDYLR